MLVGRLCAAAFQPITSADMCVILPLLLIQLLLQPMPVVCFQQTSKDVNEPTTGTSYNTCSLALIESLQMAADSSSVKGRYLLVMSASKRYLDCISGDRKPALQPDMITGSSDDRKPEIESASYETTEKVDSADEARTAVDVLQKLTENFREPEVEKTAMPLLTERAQPKPDVDVRRRSICLTAECAEQMELATFQPCSGMPASQCSALVALLDEVLKRQQQHLDDSGLLDRRRPVELVESLPVSSTTSVQQSKPDVLDYDDDEKAVLLLRQAVLAKLRGLVDEYRLWKISNTGWSDDDKDDDDFGQEDEGMNRLRTAIGSGFSRRLRRSRRAVMPPPAALQLKRLDKLSPEAQAIIEAYMAWRAQNGYGQTVGRWG